MLVKSLLLVFAVSFIITISPVYAQHHSGSLAPPIDFDGLKVAVSTTLFPEDFSYGDSKTTNLSIRFFNTETNLNIQKVTYRVQIFQDSNLVANEYFYDDDGKLDLTIKPTTGCEEKELWKCTIYNGEKHAIAGGYYARGDSFPTIQGPIFDKSGQYSIEVSIVGATNPKTLTTKDLLFETFLHIPQKQIFEIKTASAQEFPISVKSHNDEISNFTYDETLDKISYEIPFDWNEPDNNSNISQIISFEKDFSPMKHEHEQLIFLNGVKIDNEFFEFNISNPNKNFIKINIPYEDLLQMKSKLTTTSNDDTIKLEILSGEKIKLNQLNFSFDNNLTGNISWDSKLTSGKKIPFTFSFFDENNKPLNDLLFVYGISDSSRKEIWSNLGDNDKYLGILASHGIHQESILIPNDGHYEFKLILTGKNYNNFDKYFESTSDFQINSQSILMDKKTNEIPSWIKNNAGWWAEGTIDDDSFVQGIQYLFKGGMLPVVITLQPESVSTEPEIIPEPEEPKAVPEPTPESNFDLQVIMGSEVYDLSDTATIDFSIDGISTPQNVALEISDPRGTSIISRSFEVDSQGVPFEFRIDENFKTGTYKVVATSSDNGNTITNTAYFKVKSQYNSFKITSVQVTDQQGNQSNLQAGEMGFIKVNLEANKSITTLVTVNLFDSDLTSIGIGLIKTTLSSGNSEIILSFMIPSDVAVGTSDIYVNAFSDWPSNGGIPLTGEISIAENIK